MRKNPTKRIERYRVVSGQTASSREDGANGMFMIPAGGNELRVIVSDGTTWRDDGLPGEPWEHVSISLTYRTPTWGEMAAVKDIFWRDDEVVMQLHVAKSAHVNCHEFCLHLWKPKKTEIPLPPQVCVGPRV